MPVSSLTMQFISSRFCCAIVPGMGCIRTGHMKREEQREEKYKRDVKKMAKKEGEDPSAMTLGHP